MAGGNGEKLTCGSGQTGICLQNVFLFYLLEEKWQAVKFGSTLFQTNPFSGPFSGPFPNTPKSVPTIFGGLWGWRSSNF